ncbi:hypothetical protein N3K66_003752 [Trichothecium roseum]|uniref:Uncharacterized protein n=1 Tax=Trichothecium roseum TaxID=47278 RepID=A0ACC0V6D1_9HYPO|nr:hypothetical protein N3K66_003752 [Trichothecium roseum]
MYVHALIPPTNLPEVPNSTAPTRIQPSLRLRRAIRAADVLLVRRILKNHPHLLHNPDPSPEGGSDSSLHLAAALGHGEVCRLLLGLGHEEPTAALNEDHRTALMLAAEGGHAETVHLLCERDPAVVLKRDRRGRDAIMAASGGGHDTALQILLTYVPGGPREAVARCDSDGNTALHFASANGNLLVARTLLAAGADAAKTNHGNWPATSYSATVSAEVYIKNLAKGLDPEVVRRQQPASPQKKNQKNLKQTQYPEPPHPHYQLQQGQQPQYQYPYQKPKQVDKPKTTNIEPGKMAGGLRMVPNDGDDDRMTPRTTVV